jgi:hypothetical protein
MMIPNLSIVKKKFTNLRVQIYFLASVTFFVQLSSFQGEDIVNARENFLTGRKTDFWGGASTLVYAHIPSPGVKWQILLALVQILITTSGILMFFRDNPTRKRIHVLSLMIIYSSLVFGSQMTRDGLLFSLLILGFGLIHLQSKSHGTNLAIATSIAIIFVAMSFRPWMAVAVGPLLIYFLNKRGVKLRSAVLLLASLAIVPIILDAGSAMALGLKKSYPQQQVMMMDLAATHCYSNNENSVDAAKAGLKIFTKDPEYFKTICEIYRPDTWESLTMAGHASAKGLKTDFWLIEAGDSMSYEELKNSWINLVISDPVTYFQNKILFVGKLIIGSDSRNVTLLSGTSTLEKIESLYKFPFEIAITLHLFSILMCFIFLMIIPFWKFLRQGGQKLILDRSSMSNFFSLFLWSWLSAIAYIGSNGRYTYSISILGLIIFVSQLSTPEESLHGK